MKKVFLNLSISQKTLLLLVTFILLPLTIIGSIFMRMYWWQDIQTEEKEVFSRLNYIAESITERMDTVQIISKTLSMDAAVSDVAEKKEESFMHLQCNNVMKNALEYNDFIIKLQILSDSDIIWQYGPGYSFEYEGNAEYMQLMDEGVQSPIWSDAHKLYNLEQGRFEDLVWVVSYYSEIYGPKGMNAAGILAVHMDEQTLSEMYVQLLNGTPWASWLVTKDGNLLSSSNKEWLSKKLPSGLEIHFEGKEGYVETKYEGEKVKLFYEKCGNYDFYLVQMNEQKGIFGKDFWIISWTFIVCVLLGIGYLYFHRIFVTKPLGMLMKQMKCAEDLEISMNALPVGKDEIGALTNTFQNMMNHIKDLINKVYVEKIKTQEAEREVMLSQINPHFLYNTLDSIRWNALSHGDHEVGKQLEALSLMLRNTLNMGNTETTIRLEIQTIENYCYLLQARFRKEIQVIIDVESVVENLRIPKLLIQPLVENAYKHGLENKTGLKMIWIKVRKFRHKLLIYVADNGIGCDQKEILKKMENKDTRECFALKNIRDRIFISYGEKGFFLFRSRKDVGTLVKIILPLDGIVEG